MMGSKSEKSAFSILGLSHKFFKAFEKAGGTPADANAIAQKPDLMSDLLRVHRGQAMVECIKHLIDCDATPYIPEGWFIHPEDQIKSRVTGKVAFDPSKAELFLTEGQKDDFVVGNDLKQMLEGQSVLSANMLDCLLEHPELIPESWRGKRIYFWGTIYRCEDTDLIVRYLEWTDDEWNGNDNWLDCIFGGTDPAAVAA